MHEKNTSAIYEDTPLISVLKATNGESYAFHLGGGVSQVMRITGKNPTSMNAAAFDQLFHGLESAFGSTPYMNASIQFCAVKRKRKKSELSNDESTPRLIRARASNINALIDQDALFEYDLYLSVFMHGEQVGLLNKVKSVIRSLRKRKNDPAADGKIQFAGIADKIFTLSDTVNSMRTVLERHGIQSETLKTDQEYYNMWRWFTAPNDTVENRELKIGLDESFRQAVWSPSQHHTFTDHFLLNNSYHKVFSMDRSPIGAISGGDIMTVLRAPCEAFFSYTFMKLDREATLKRIGNSLWAKKFAISSAGENDTPDAFAEASYQQAEAEFHRLADGGSLGVLGSANVVIRIDADRAHIEAERQNIELRQYLRKVEQDLRTNGFDQFGKSEWSTEQDGAWPVYCHSIPGFAELNTHWLKPIFMAANDTPFFMPVYSYESGNEFHGTNGYVTETGSLYAFDILSKQLPTWNWMISGQSGSGKSVLINSIIAQEVANYYGRRRTNPDSTHPIICIMDVGGVANSFTKTVSLLGGTIVNLSSVRKPQINLLDLNPILSSPVPEKMKQVQEYMEQHLEVEKEHLAAALIGFYQSASENGTFLLNDQAFALAFEEAFGEPMPKGAREIMTLKVGECEPNADQMNLIMGILEVMISTTPKKYDVFESGEFRRDKVEMIVYSVYRSIKNRCPFISDIVEFLEKEKLTDEGRELISRLRSWTRESKYPMFDLPTNVNTEAHIILVDFKGVESDPKLQAIYNLLFSRIFSDKMFRKKNHRRMMIRDEAWEHMLNAASRKYFESDLRQARKHGYATVTASQSVMDFLKPDREQGIAVLGQIAANIFGYEREGNVDQVRDLLKIEPEIANLLPQLGAVKSHGVTQFTTFLLKIKNQYVTIQNRLHPFEANVYSSSDDDNAVIDYYRKLWDKRLKSLDDIISYIADGEHYGDEGLVKHLMDTGRTDMAKRFSVRRRR